MMTFYVCLFLVAFFYATVGHGGASGYLVLMVFYDVAPEVMKPTALILNLFVSFIAFIQFYRYFIKEIFLYLVLSSMPLAFVGGMIQLDQKVYKRLLGICLLCSIVRLLVKNIPIREIQKTWKIPLCLFMGGSIGFLSGLIGIGGGIILSPVLILLGWMNQKQASAISALFIFFNSLSGLLGQSYKGISCHDNVYIYIIIALCGGLLGAYFGAKRLSNDYLKYVLAMVLFVASCKLLFFS